MKKFKNNKNLESSEEWKEYDDGQIRVTRVRDDGLGQKKTSEYGLGKRGDQIEYEFEKAVIDDIRNGQMIEIKRGKNFNEREEEWEN